MLLEINDIEKSYRERKIVSLKKLTLDFGDKITVVGKNGAGKTTLLRMIAGQIAPDAGRIRSSGRVGVIAQLGRTDPADVDARIAGRLGIDRQCVYSGGEKTKQRIAAALSQPCDILLADEPTTNLDINGIQHVQAMLGGFKGGLLLVSHDRELLASVCNKVLEIDRGACTLYHCGYDEYVDAKAQAVLHDRRRYEQYAAERKRLGRVADEKARSAARVRRAPRRMGNAEARLHKMGDQRAKASLQRSASAARTRLDQLEKVEKPWEQRPIVFDVPRRAVHSPWLVTAADVSKAYGGRMVLDRCAFNIPNGKKTALIGKNGSGKTTLLDMICRGADGISRSRTLRIGYFRQDLGGIDEGASVLQNAMDESIYGQQFVRTVLARLLFHRSDIDKRAGLLSGGERIKLAIAKILLSDYNLLVLDEPTNYLDIESRVALEAVLAAYDGAVLFVSHDRAFLHSVADRIICIEDGCTSTFEGGYDAFESRA